MARDLKENMTKMREMCTTKGNQMEFSELEVYLKYI